MLIRPFFLQTGDIVGIVAPGGKISTPDMNRAIEVIEGWGVRVELGNHLFEENSQFAGTDQQRIADLQQMLDEPSIKAILCARGGYGTTRIILLFSNNQNGLPVIAILPPCIVIYIAEVYKVFIPLCRLHSAKQKQLIQ
jgi:muramoyltetrapeptide carboxypeptidase LdcA involved in peptidoglycan recycling